MNFTAVRTIKPKKSPIAKSVVTLALGKIKYSEELQLYIAIINDKQKTIVNQSLLECTKDVITVYPSIHNDKYIRHSNTAKTVTNFKSLTKKKQTIIIKYWSLYYDGSSIHKYEIIDNSSVKIIQHG